MTCPKPEMPQNKNLWAFQMFYFYNENYDKIKNDILLCKTGHRIEHILNEIKEKVDLDRITNFKWRGIKFWDANINQKGEELSTAIPLVKVDELIWLKKIINECSEHFNLPSVKFIPAFFIAYPVHYYKSTYVLWGLAHPVFNLVNINIDPTSYIKREVVGYYKSIFEAFSHEYFHHSYDEHDEKKVKDYEIVKCIQTYLDEFEGKKIKNEEIVQCIAAYCRDMFYNEEIEKKLFQTILKYMRIFNEFTNNFSKFITGEQEKELIKGAVDLLSAGYCGVEWADVVPKYGYI